MEMSQFPWPIYNTRQRAVHEEQPVFKHTGVVLGGRGSLVQSARSADSRTLWSLSPGLSSTSSN